MPNKFDSQPGEMAGDVERAIPTGHNSCVEMCGSDRRMDTMGIQDVPLNVLPVKCQLCRFVDLDFVPQRYVLCKGIDSSADMAIAEVGNFLVREQLRRVLEVVAPGQCAFYPTQNLKTKQSPPWFLAVPKQILPTGKVKQSIKSCPDCGEPASAHGTQYETRRQISASPYDIFKSLNWISVGVKAPDYSMEYYRNCVDHRHALRLSRHLYFSVRLELLLKKFGARGMCRTIYFTVKPTTDDLFWVKEKLRLLESMSGGSSSADASNDSERWFEDYLTAKSKKRQKVFDFEAVEKQGGISLPTDYKKFITKIGCKTFKNMDDEEGFDIRILPPEELDFQELRRERREAAKTTDDEPIDGVVFAVTEHGDVLCFDVTKRNGDYPVYLYEHEMDEFEPFTANFAACIKRLAGS